MHFKRTSERGRARVGVCGLCRERKKLSDTHVPPKACGNRGDMRSSGVDLNTNMTVSSRPKPGGVRGYFLCEPCNGATGRWDEDLVLLQKTLMHGLLHAGVDETWIDLELSFNEKIRAGRLARAICAGVFAMNETFASDFPSVADAIVGGHGAELPSSVRLHMALTTDLEIFASSQRGGTAVRHGEDALAAERLPSSVIHVPPMCFALTEGNSPVPVFHADISHWIAHDVDENCPPVNLNFVTLGSRPSMVPIASGSYRVGHSDLAQWSPTSDG